jgi:hypothetical protein
MTTAVIERSFFDVVIGEPLELAKDQPHQILLSTGSVALMSSFASSSNILHPLAGFCIAVGVEWAYLRGLASDARAQTRWGGILNWSAFAIVVLWGVLWVAQQLGAVVEQTGGWWLAAAHVVPVAWLSLCSAQCHRAAMGAERAELKRASDREATQTEAERAYQAGLQKRRDDQQLALEAEWKRELLAIEAEKQRAELKMQAQNARIKMRRDALPASTNAEPQTCPKCGVFIESRSTWLAARRWQRCAACKETPVA